jgi:hypothetical protein
MNPRYHGSSELSEGGKYKMSMELDQKLYHLARLQINNVAKIDSGEYKAIAKNKHGQGVATINLNFEGGDKLKYDLILFPLRMHTSFSRRISQFFLFLTFILLFLILFFT